MNTITSNFLTAKHWQIFLGFVLLVCTAVAAMLSSLLRSPEQVFDHMFPFLAVMEMFAIFFALWVWSLGVFLNSIVPPHLRMKETFFRISVAFVPLYLPIFGIFFRSLNQSQNVRLILISVALIIPLHFFALFCQIYGWYFASKAIALAESAQSVLFADYVGYFVGFWIFPVGVWIIQPRINRLYASAVHPLSS